MRWLLNSTTGYLTEDYQNSLEIITTARVNMDSETRQSIVALFRDKDYATALDTMLVFLEDYMNTNYFSYMDMAEYYSRAGNLVKAIEWIRKAYEIHDPNMPYLTTLAYDFDMIKDDPSIISIVEKMHLPVLEN